MADSDLPSCAPGDSDIAPEATTRPIPAASLLPLGARSGRVLERRSPTPLRESVGLPWRLVCVGGGTGLPVLLAGLNERLTRSTGDSSPVDASRLTAIVSVSDDGGSSGRLIDAYGTLPPGDVRNCVLALADPSASELIRQFFGHRFGDEAGGPLAGHSAGNLMILALAQLHRGDFRKTILDLGRLFALRGRILLPTLEPTILGARLADGDEVLGESAIPLRRNRSPIERVFLRHRGDPGRPLPAMAEAVEAITAADAIVLSPGSLYTSLLPNLLVPEIAAALRRTEALRVFVCNLVTEVGETDNFSVEDHVRAIHRHAGFWPDVVIANRSELSDEALRNYALDAFRQDWEIGREVVEELLNRLPGADDSSSASLAAVEGLQARIAHLMEKAARLRGGRISVLPEESESLLPYRLVLADLAEEVRISDRGVRKRVLRHAPERVVDALCELFDAAPNIPRSTP